MDEKLLKALTDISSGMETLAEVISSSNKDNNSDAVSSAFKTAGIDTQLKVVIENLKEVKSDTSKLLKGQDQLLKIANEKKNSNVGGFDFSTSKSLKAGVGIIALMAGSILALGLAFKIVGEVDFMSVIALSIAMPLLATSFEKVANIKNLNYGTVKTVSLSMLAMATTVALSSYILSHTSLVSPYQLLTIIGISGAFSLLGFGISKLAKGVENISPKGLLLMPLVLTTTSLAIVAASYILGETKPVGLLQLATAIGVSAIFGVIGLGLGALSRNIEKVNLASIAILPVVMIGMSLAVVASSRILSDVTPFTGGISGFLTIAGIAATFVLFGYALAPLSKSLKDVHVESLIILPLVMVSMSLAVVAASAILANTTNIDTGKLLNIMLVSGALSVSTLLISPAIYVIDKIGEMKMLKGAIVLPIIAGALALSSVILAKGEYSNYPSISWAIGSALSLGAFGLGASILGGILSTGAGAIAMGLGVIAIPLLAGAIVLTDKVLSSGSYTNGPSLEWATSTSLLLGTFGLGAMTLGAFVMGTLGLGAAAMAAGSLAVISLAKTIVESSKILSTGTYSGGPTSEWADGVSKAIGAFSPVYAMLVANNIMDIFGLGVSADDFNNAIKLISGGIVYASNIFSQASGTWSGGPTPEWAEGVGKSISAFAPVYAILMADNILSAIGMGVSVESFNKAIETIAYGIINAGEIFASGNGLWGSAPTKEWADNVATSIGAFVKVYDLGKGLFSVSPEEMLRYNMVIAGNEYSIANTMQKLASSMSIAGGGNITSMDAFYNNLNKYFEIVDKVDKYDTLFGKNPILKTATMFNTLASSIKMLGESINSLDLSKLESFQLFTGITVDLLKLDDAKYRATMEAFKDRTESIRGVYDNMDNQIMENSEKSKTLFESLGDGLSNLWNKFKGSDKPDSEKTITDLYNTVEELKMIIANETEKRSDMYDNIEVAAIKLSKK